MPPDEGGDEGDGGTGGRFLGGLGLGGEPPSAALERVRAHDFLDHAHLETLLEAAELTPVPPPFVHRAALLRQTHVLRALLYSSLEETCRNKQIDAHERTVRKSNLYTLYQYGE